MSDPPFHQRLMADIGRADPDLHRRVTTIARERGMTETDACALLYNHYSSGRGLYGRRRR